MSLATRLSDLATAVASSVKSVKTLVNGNAADLSELTTAAKGNLVLAVNEVNAKTANAGAAIDDATARTTTVFSSSKTNAVAAAAAAAVINDTAAAGSTAYSSTKVTADIAAAKAALKTEILGGASAAYDTLLELQNIDISQDSSIASLVTADGNRLRFDAAQSLTAPQMVQGNINLGSASLLATGNLDQNLVAVFTAGLS